MKLLLVINGLNCGGAERVITLLANHWVNCGFSVSLVTLTQGVPFFPLDPKVERLTLSGGSSAGPWEALASLLRTTRHLRRLVKGLRPDGVISFTTRVNVKTLIAVRGLGVPVVVSERNDPSQKPLNRGWTWLRDLWYPRAHRLVVQTEGVRKWFLDRGLERLTVLPNPVAPTNTPRHETNSSPLVLNVARLMPQKGQQDLVRAVAGLARTDVRLRILGDGPERAALRALGDQLGLGSRLELPGFVADKEPHYEEAAVFVLSSYYEGFPNALVEAMAAGLPCVSYNCPSGPAELIDHETNGLLVPLKDVSALGRAIDRVLGDPIGAQAWAQAAPAAVSSLGVEAIARQWEALFR